MRLGFTATQMNRLEELQEQRDQLPNVERYNRLSLAGTLQWAVERNLEELENREKKITAAPNAANAQAQLLEFGRLLLNYLSASIALVDHCFSYMNHHAEEDLKRDLDADIRAAADDPLSRFVKDLRHVCLHCFFPMLTIVRERGADRVVFRRSELLDEYDNWSSGAREYLEGGGDYLEVLPTLRCHRDLVMVFRRRLWHAVHRAHKADFEAIEATQDEMREIYFSVSAETEKP